MLTALAGWKMLNPNLGKAKKYPHLHHKIPKALESEELSTQETCICIGGWEYRAKNRMVNRKSFYEAVRLPVPPPIPCNFLLTAEA